VHLLAAYSSCSCPKSRASGKIVEVRTATELRAAVAAAIPGTTIVVGRARTSACRSWALRGEPGKPIVLANADATSPATFLGMQLSDVEFVELHGLQIQSAPENG
jgi:hypothetical protein